jgi:hypothetical protein
MDCLRRVVKKVVSELARLEALDATRFKFDHVASQARDRGPSTRRGVHAAFRDPPRSDLVLRLHPLVPRAKKRME